jgi:ribosomal protein S27AE
MAGRDYYVEGQGTDEADHAICPRCTVRTVITDYPESFEPDKEVWRPFRDAVAASKETGAGSVTCPVCGVSVQVTE